MARARPIPGLAADTRFGDAAAAAVQTRAREVFAHAGGVLDRGEIERVHDMRVATRRLRAALEVFAPCFPRKRHRELLGEVKRLADALGERRDPDVAIENLRELQDAFHEADHAGIESLVGELRGDQDAGNERLATALEHAQASELEQRLLALAEKART
ncbi:MAG TPA: CHAD domain-containing protein [Thermoleophilaceae bacterium]|nr:CHAD domain-containing protein [Thermoleophilaceae bacterium]